MGYMRVALRAEHLLLGGGSVLSKTGETCKPCENSSRIGNGKRKRRRILLRELYDLHSTDFFDHHPGSTGREREERERERERDLFNDEGNRAPVSRAAPS